jgi:hypothetical protein
MPQQLCALDRFSEILVNFRPDPPRDTIHTDTPGQADVALAIEIADR